MNLKVKRCLLGLVVSTTMFGIARAQDNESVGTVQIGPKAQVPAQSPAGALPDAPFPTDIPPSPGVVTFPVVPAQATDSPPGPTYTPSGAGATPSTPAAAPAAPAQPGYGNFFRVTPVDQVMTPRFTISSQGGGLYGYNTGFTNIGAFVPYKLDDTAILFGTGLGMVTYDGRGGGTVGGGWRYYMEDLDRIVGLSTFFDFDNGHAQPYQQVGFSGESLGRYTDYRINGYIPISHPDHVLSTSLTGTSSLIGNTIGLQRYSTVEQAYSGFDAEIGGPTPILGRYGLNAYLGGYYFGGLGALGGTTTGVSGRLAAQINEDVSFGVAVTNDHLFGLNTQFQVFMNLPNGRPSRWMRNLRVQDRMLQNVYRQNRVMAHTESFNTYDVAIDPNTNKPYFVANINPNLTTNGDGSYGNPFNSIKAYEAQSLTTQQHYDLILIQPRTDKTNTNLDTNGATGTLDVFNNQRLLSTTVAQTFTTANAPGQIFTLGGFAAGQSPELFNSGGGDVITMIGGNTQIEQVSGFAITGSLTGNGIRGNNNTAVDIGNNTIQDSLNGVLLTNLSGTIASGREAQIFDNTIQNNFGNGIQITNHGSSVPPLEVVIQGNTFSSNGVVNLPKSTVFTAAELTAISAAGGSVVAQSNGNYVVTIPLSDGLRIDAQAGSTIGGIIGGQNTAATAATGTTPAVAAVTLSNIFTANTGNGLDLTANGGTLNFLNTTTSPFGIINNTFTSNVNNGLNIDTTNNSISGFTIVNNTFGNSADSVVNSVFNAVSTSTAANGNFGIGVFSDSGNMNINIGGATSLNANGTTYNPGNAFYANNVTDSSGNVVSTPGNAIDFAIGGTTALTYNIQNNIIKNTYTTNAPAPQDQFLFTVNPTGVTAVTPGQTTFTLLNESLQSTALIGQPATITGVAWNLAPSSALIAATGLGNPVVVQPTAGDTLLTSVAGVSVQTGQNPLTINAPGALLANDANLHLTSTQNQLLNLGFNKTFTTGSTFTAGTLLVQGDGITTATSANTLKSTVTVTFSDGQTATAAVTDTNGVFTATKEVPGLLSPGYGTGSDGIHIDASGNAIVHASYIQENSVTGVAGYGIHVVTSGNANASDTIVQNNTLQFNGIGTNESTTNNSITPVFTGGGMLLALNGSSAAANFGVLVEGNTANSNFNDGIDVSAGGAGTMTVNSYNNIAYANTTSSIANAANGFNIASSGSATLTYNSTGDNASGNGIGKGQNLKSIGGDDMAVSTSNTSTANINLYGITLNNATGNGLSATTNNNSTLNLLVDASTGVTTVNSSFTGNSGDGIQLVGNNTSYLHANVFNANLNSNGLNGIEYDRNSASLILSNITNTTMNSNAGNGLLFVGIGSSPNDPSQQQSGTSNLINLVNDELNGNLGTATNTEGDGAEVHVYGQSSLILNATSTTFDKNVGNGLRVDETPGAEFGDTATNTASNFSNVDISNNGANGIFISSQISGAPLGDAASRTLFDLNSVKGNTVVSNNGGDGILTQYSGGLHDITVRGDGNATPVYQTVIQANALDGIHADVGNFANTTINVDTVLVGGATKGLGNKGDGIALDVVLNTQLPGGSFVDPSSILTSQQYLFDFLHAGIGTLNVNNSLIENNAGNGITLYANSLLGTGFGAANYAARTETDFGEGFGKINANITNSSIINNGASGINIQILGYMGGDRTAYSYYGGTPGYDVFNFTNNIISNNGTYGVFYEANPALDDRHLFWLFASQPDPPGAQNVPLNPLDFYNSGYGFVNFPWNYNGYWQGQNLRILDQKYLSNWMLLATVSNNQLNMTNNTIQGNGQNHDLNNADAVKLRVGTGSYLAANLQGNNLAGNVGSSLRVESFVQYNPTNGAALTLGQSVKGSGTTPSKVELDPTAQMELNLVNNSGDSVNIVNPLTNSIGNFLGNASPNGAVFNPTSDPLKDPISTKPPLYVRMTQLFQIDNGNNLNTTNSFISNGVTQNLSTAFYNADFYLNPSATFPNSQFPSDAFTSPGNPFAF